MRRHGYPEGALDVDELRLANVRFEASSNYEAVLRQEDEMAPVGNPTIGQQEVALVLQNNGSCHPHRVSMRA